MLKITVFGNLEL